MSFSQEHFKTIGKCYFFSLALNGVFLLIYALVIALLFIEKSNPAYKTIFDFIKNKEVFVFWFSLFFLAYCIFCLLLNAAAGFFFYYDKMKEFQLPMVLINLLCLPFGTVISIFTLYALHKLKKLD
jgi:hypothetical protein